MLRTAQSLPLCRALDAGPRPDPFPDRAASLLPGPLVAPRTGPPPAGDDELMSDQVNPCTTSDAGRTPRSAVNSSGSRQRDGVGSLKSCPDEEGGLRRE